MAEIPRNGTDCHTHLFGPADRFPYAAGRAYTPSDAKEADARRMLAGLGLERIVSYSFTPVSMTTIVAFFMGLRRLAERPALSWR